MSKVIGTKTEGIMIEKIKHLGMELYRVVIMNRKTGKFTYRTFHSLAGARTAVLERL